MRAVRASMPRKREIEYRFRNDWKQKNDEEDCVRWAQAHKHVQAKKVRPKSIQIKCVVFRES